MTLKSYHWLQHGRSTKLGTTRQAATAFLMRQDEDPMMTSRRSTLAAGASGLVAAEVAGTGLVPAWTEAGGGADDVAGLLARQSEQANSALMQGDLHGYRALVTITNDFTLMSPFGGTPTRGAEFTDERWTAVGRFFANGSLEQEVVQTYSSADMVVLAVIERAHVAVGGLPPQDWALRVTLVYRRERGGWHLAHRHADPLAKGISLRLAAALARGEAT
jgi:ketosteroid isomerase-like protein